MNRRTFIQRSALASGAVASVAPQARAASPSVARFHDQSLEAAGDFRTESSLPSLEPARWVWYPSERTLQNTFVLFRRALQLEQKPRRATGWVFADSRYLLELNGERIQWGPAPCDPRWQEVDPVDLSGRLQAGPNVLAATVLHYGVGDGTWPAGKPGFLFCLDLEYETGKRERIVSDAAWQCLLARAWKPGQYKRWFLRALQEEFDARLFPYGWNRADFQPDDDWLPAMVLKNGLPSKPSIFSGYRDYQQGTSAAARDAALRTRSVPLLREFLVPARRLAESIWVDWSRPPQEYFECGTPQAYREVREASATETAPGEWSVTLPAEIPNSKIQDPGKSQPSKSRGAVLTFEFEEQIVGWPYFTIEAPAGTVVELLVHEAHQVGGPGIMNSHFDSWSRFVCRAGETRFETFDFESLRWLQLHLHGAPGRVRVKDIGVRRRIYPWPHEPQIRLSDPALQRLMDASVNTLHNCAQETLVDGMARERQQYSGDGSHQLHAIYAAFGETRQPARFLSTFSQGLSVDGYFMDCWPAYDRLARVAQRQLQMTGWGPILDHGVEFNFNCWNHYLYTGDRAGIREVFPRLLRFADYLRSLLDRDGLLPVEDLGVPSVWMDHAAYKQQAHKQCAFNLYVAAMLEHALAPLCALFGQNARAELARESGRRMLDAAVRKFWSPSERLFIANLPWLTEEKNQKRYCDRSLATAVLFDQCPGGHSAPALRMLAECPPEMGFSYPANAGWRLWALAKGGRGDLVLKDLRERWAGMDSVRLNNTLGEFWTMRPDTGSQWSHCAVVPLYVLYMNIAGIKPLAPGFRRCEIWPQLADLESVELTARTVQGPIYFTARGRVGSRDLYIKMPADCDGELVLRREENVALQPVSGRNPPGFLRYLLTGGHSTRLALKFT